MFLFTSAFVFSSCSLSPKKLDFQTLELANDEQSRARGLMMRELLCEQCGMLFKFDESQNVSFWMKNTLIPLDIIFIKGNGEITDIHKNAEPLKIDRFYKSSGKVLYALEVNAGYSEKIGLKVQDKLDVKYLAKQAHEQ